MVMSDETQVGRAFNDARVKMLTGSTSVKARYMRQDFFTYDSTVKLWVLGNAKPIIRDTSAGMWRRMQLVPFTQTIPADRRILRYEEQLREEWAGILNWALEGLAAWLGVGSLGAPMAITDAVQTYRDEEDSFGQWMKDRLEACTGAELPIPLAYQDYVTWMAYQGYGNRDVLNNTHFGRAMATHGYVRGETNLPASMTADGRRGKIRFYRGARLVGSG
jgi:putative DNA primase/helicase